MNARSAGPVFPPPADGAWQGLLGALLGGWYGDSSSSAAACDSANGPSPVRSSTDCSADEHGVPDRVFESLAALEGRRRRQMLSTLRERCASAAADFAHPSWLAEIPVPSAQTPPWCAGLRTQLLRRAVPFPAPFPWRMSDGRPSTFLWALPAEACRRLIVRHGLRPLALAVRALGTSAPRRLGFLAYALDPADRTVLTRRVRDLAYEGVGEEAGGGAEEQAEAIGADTDVKSMARGWLAELDRLEAATPELDPPTGLGSLELALRSVAAGPAAVEDMVRLAYRLPREVGIRLLEALRRVSGDGDLPDAASGEDDLSSDLEELVAEGVVDRPRVAALRREAMR